MINILYTFQAFSEGAFLLLGTLIFMGSTTLVPWQMGGEEHGII
ncbi:hypothetical protein [Sphingobacterium shayense]|nr:hypothetical protein [Sphingobacterium shayense]